MIIIYRIIKKDWKIIEYKINNNYNKKKLKIKSFQMLKNFFKSLINN